jgi:hypothetical protein
MWFLVIVAGNVLLIAAWTQAERVRRTGHPALASFTESAILPVFGASILVALGLAAHDAAWTLAWVLLAYAAGIMIISVAGRLAERVRRAGHPALGSFTESAGLPVSVAFLWVALELALHDAVWTAMAWQILTFLLVYAVFAVRRSLRRRRNTA